MKDVDAISADVVNIAIRIHQELGPGLLESVYEVVLAYLRLLKQPSGLLLNFSGETMKESSRRLVNNLRPTH